MVTEPGPVPPPEDEEELPPHPDKERTVPAQTNANRANGRGIALTPHGIRVLRTSLGFEAKICKCRRKGCRTVCVSPFRCKKGVCNLVK